jgi:hypothetical protein
MDRFSEVKGPVKCKNSSKSYGHEIPVILWTIEFDLRLYCFLVTYLRKIETVSSTPSKFYYLLTVWHRSAKTIENLKQNTYDTFVRYLLVFLLEGSSLNKRIGRLLKVFYNHLVMCLCGSSWIPSMLWYGCSVCHRSGHNFHISSLDLL